MREERRKVQDGGSRGSCSRTALRGRGLNAGGEEEGRGGGMVRGGTGGARDQDRLLSLSSKERGAVFEAYKSEGDSDRDGDEDESPHDG
jgi:hypothetical protein